MQIQLMISESATRRKRPTSAPDWWKKLSKNQQQAYLSKHPKSYLAEFAKKSDVPRKQKVKPEQAKRKSSVHNNKKVKRNPNKARALAEKQRREREQDLARDKAPAIKRGIASSLQNAAESVTSIARTIGERMSPLATKSLGGFLDAKRAGADLSEHENGRKVANKVLMSVIHAALGAATIAAIAGGIAPLAGTLAAAYMGFSDYRKSLEGTKYENQTDQADPDTENSNADGTEDSDYDEDTSMLSTSSSDNPVLDLAEDFYSWLGNQDLDSIAETFAQYAAIEQMEQEQWSPDMSLLDDSELEEMVSTSSVTPRLTFRIADNLKGKSPDRRGQYDIVFSGRQIGRVVAKSDFPSKAQRVWTVELTDGFNESAFRSGKHDSEPYTIVRQGDVALINPTAFTFMEACSWSKCNIERAYL